MIPLNLGGSELVIIGVIVASILAAVALIVVLVRRSGV